MVLIFLVFCVVIFGGGSVVLIFLVFGVVVSGEGVRGAHLFRFSVLWYLVGGPWCSSF